MVTTRPPQKGSPTALIATVLLLTFAMVALVGGFLWLGGPADRAYWTAEVRFVRAVFAVAITLPFLVAPVALLARRVHFGLVTALTTAALYVVGVGWIAVIIAVLSGFSSNRDQRTAALLPAAAIFLQIAVFVAALMALRRLPASQRRPGVVGYGVGISVLLAVGGVMAVVGAQQLAVRFSEQMVTNEASARNALKKLHSCATAFASASANGLPPDLSALGPSGTRCLDPELAQGRSPGYRIDYLAGVPDARGSRKVFAACAQPTLAHLQTLVVDDDGDVQALWVDERLGPTADLPLPCTHAWAGHPLALAKTIKHCAVAFAARHPEVGYPVSLGQLARDDDGCPHDEGHEHDWELKVWRVAYLSAAPGADGVVRGYRLYITKYQLQGVAVVDENGAFINHDDPDAFDLLGRRRRVAAPKSDGEAAAMTILGVKLPSGYRAPEPRPNAGANAEEPDLPDDARPEDYQDACAKGDATACYTAGKAYHRRAARGTADVLEDLRRAGLAYQKACEGQMARGCYQVGEASLGGRWLEQDLSKALAWITKSCALGYAGACSKLGEIYESGRSSTRKASVKILATPTGRTPSTISTRVEDPQGPGIPKDVGHAISAYSRACEMGGHEACLFAARLTRDDPSDASGGQKAFAQFASLCEGGDGAACDAAAAMVASGVVGNERSEAEWRRMACVFGQVKACSPGK